MPTPILDLFSPMVLVGIGIAFIAIEVFVTSFVIIWFGIGLIIVGLLTQMDLFQDGIWQLTTASLIALVLLFTLRAKMMQRFLNSEDDIPQENFFDRSGTGVIQNGMVYYKATHWKIVATHKDETFKDGEEVIVLHANKGEAQIEKKIQS